MAKLKRVVGYATLILGGLVFGVLILEIGLRIAGISYPSFSTLDEDSCWAYRPGVQEWYREEGEAYIRISNDGLRDREHSKVKPANTLRVAVLGDSYAAAFQVPMEATFWSVMEQELEGCEALSGQQIEVINLGVDGYGTAQELTTLRNRAWDYDPDLVLLAFTTGNDISDNSYALNSDPMRPYFILRDGEVVLDAMCTESDAYRARQTWFAQLGYPMVNFSRILQLVNEAKNALKDFRLARNRDVASAEAFEEAGLDNTVYLEPEDTVWIEAWRVTEELIRLMRDEVMEKESDFLVVTLSNGIQVHPDPIVRKEFIETASIDNLFYPDLRIKALGEREGFSVLNLAQTFQAYAEEHQVFLHGFENTALGEGHWNVEGHRLAGQLISHTMCQQLLDDR